MKVSTDPQSGRPCSLMSQAMKKEAMYPTGPVINGEQQRVFHRGQEHVVV